MAQHTTFRGYAQLPRYQYHNFAHVPVQYSTVPLYAAPPVHPAFDPPTDHPVENDEEKAAEAEGESLHTESDGSLAGNFS